MTDLYTCAEVAQRYGVEKFTVWEWIRKRKLGAIKLGKEYRISVDDLQQFENSRRINPQPNDTAQ
jgi:excisionase family DNA binding protein